MLYQAEPPRGRTGDLHRRISAAFSLASHLGNAVGVGDLASSGRTAGKRFDATGQNPLITSL
jgi:hypothetical protein